MEQSVGVNRDGVSPEFFNSSYAEAFKQLENIERILEMDSTDHIENKMTPLQLRHLINIRIDKQSDNKIRTHLQAFQEEINALLDGIPDDEKSVSLTEEKIAEIRAIIQKAKSGFLSNSNQTNL